MSTSKQREPYLKQYRANILSRLREIDIFIKTKPAPYSFDDAAEILGMSRPEF